MYIIKKIRTLSYPDSIYKLVSVFYPLLNAAAPETISVNSVVMAA